MWLTIRSREGDPRSLEIAKERLVIGREEGCDLLLEDDKVSREHAALSVNPEGHIIVEDLRSTNGTYVNGRRITEPTHLGPDDELRIGESQINASVIEPGTGAPRTMLAGPGMTVQQGAQSAPPSAPSPVVPPPPPQEPAPQYTPPPQAAPPPMTAPSPGRRAPGRLSTLGGSREPVPYRAHHAAQVGQAGPDHRGDRGCRSAHRHPRRRALRHRRDRRRGGGSGTTADRLRDHRLGEALDGADPRDRFPGTVGRARKRLGARRPERPDRDQRARHERGVGVHGPDRRPDRGAAGHGRRSCSLRGPRRPQGAEHARAEDAAARFPGQRPAG